MLILASIFLKKPVTISRECLIEQTPFTKWLHCNRQAYNWFSCSHKSIISEGQSEQIVSPESGSCQDKGTGIVCSELRCLGGQHVLEYWASWLAAAADTGWVTWQRRDHAISLSLSECSHTYVHNKDILKTSKLVEVYMALDTVHLVVWQ